MVYPPSELVCYMLDLSLCGVLIPLDMNLEEFSGDHSAIIGSLSMNVEFLLFVKELLKIALIVVSRGTILFSDLKNAFFHLCIIRIYRRYRFC